MPDKSADDMKLFLSNIHHELKTCIGGIESAFATVANGKGDPEMSKKLFQVSLNRINHLLEEIEKRKGS
jgi:signal transduction histidine kinase